MGHIGDHKLGLNKKKNGFAILSVLPLILSLHISPLTFTSEKNIVEGSNQIATIASQNNLGSDIANKSSANALCNCVVFRMDDIQDYWLNAVQNAVMDLFLSKNQVLSLGLIMNSVGNDTKVVDKLREGLDRHLFELNIHGWDHVSFTEMSQAQQKESLIKAEEKMQDIFNTTSSVFIPPLSVFDNKTLSTLSELGFKVISSDIPEETKFNQNRSIFVADGEHNDTTKAEIASRKGLGLYHLPATVFFNDYEKGEWIKIPNEEIIWNATRNIEKYGYAVIVLHPQDFAISSENESKSVFINSNDRKEFEDLSMLLDALIERKINIRGFTEIITDHG